MICSRPLAMALLNAAITLSASPALAGIDLRSGGKLLLTNGISTIEGQAGGGLTPWAVIAGNATKDGIGLQASLTGVALKSYDFASVSAAVGAFDRVELSYARQRFDTNEIGAALGLGRDFTFDQDVYGVKLRVAGDLVYGAEAMPAIAIGTQYKRSRDPAVVRAIGAKHRDGIDYHVSASKLLLRHSLLVNTTVRATKANQNGLLGFGGDKSDEYDVRLEGSVAWQLSRGFAIGGEFRSKPDKLGIAREEDWLDLFAALAIGRHLTATVAYADLGQIATVKGQRGVFLQLQAGF